MLQSHLIEADGVFLGAAVRLDTGYRFVAVDLRVEPLDETTWPDLGELRRLARHLFTTGRFPERPKQDERLIRFPGDRPRPPAPVPVSAGFGV